MSRIFAAWNVTTGGATNRAVSDELYPMNAVLHASEYYGPKNWYISGPHFRDYYLLLDEQADHIFTMRLAAHIREARGICDKHADLATASLLEIWIDDSEKHVWYVFESYPHREATDSS